MALQFYIFLALLAHHASAKRYAPSLARNIGSSTPPVPRRPLKSSPIGSPEQYQKFGTQGEGAGGGHFLYKLIVKFSDTAKVRVPGGGRAHMAAASAHTEDGSAQLEIAGVIASLAVTLSPIFDAADAELDELVHRAEVASGTAQPDLHGIFEIGLSAEDAAHLVEAAKRFEELHCVEYVSIQEVAPPPPVELRSNRSSRPCHLGTAQDGVIPDFEHMQGYMRSDQLDVDYLHGLGDLGAGIRYTDVEYGFVKDHKEFEGADITVYRQPSSGMSKGYVDHGTASLGLTMGQTAPGTGIKGIAYRADARFSTEWTDQGWDRAQGVRTAIVNSRPGDVILLEMQDTIATDEEYGPAELDPTIWSLIKTGTDAGVVIVAAAGNGNQNLDSDRYAAYRDRGDSGAIIVGAGDANHVKAGFSTHGARVDVQALGDRTVMTSGYGDCTGFTGNDNVNTEYTHSFAGTSSASAITAGAVTLFQSWALRVLGEPLDPVQLRTILKTTGRPQSGGGGNIGPHINLKAASEMARTGTAAPTPAPPVPTPAPDPACVDTRDGCCLSAKGGHCEQGSPYYDWTMEFCCASCNAEPLGNLPCEGRGHSLSAGHGAWLAVVFAIGFTARRS